MKKILIVDDNETILEMLQELLEMKGFQVQVVSAGNRVQEMVGREMPDLVLLDILLGKYNGVDICRAIKENPGTSHVPVLLMSAIERPLHLVRQEILPDDFIAKPFDLLHLLSRIEILAA